MRDSATRWLGRPTVWFWLVAGLIAAGDQAAKWAISSHLAPGDSWRLIPRVLSFSLRHNEGGAFGAFSWASEFLVFVAIAVVALLTAYGPRAAQASRLLGIGAACELGGALGNLTDRALRGRVVDFINIHIWPVFNAADIAIVAGAVLIGIFLVHGGPRRADGTAAADDILAAIFSGRPQRAEEPGLPSPAGGPDE